MPLQKLTISKIDEPYGLNLIVAKLKKSLKILNNDEKHHIENTIIYFRTLYNCDVDVAQDIIDYKDYALGTLGVLNKIIDTNNCFVIKHVKKILEYNLEYTSNVKKIG